MKSIMQMMIARSRRDAVALQKILRSRNAGRRAAPPNTLKQNRDSNNATLRLVGGVYSNYLALETAIGDARRRSADALYCLD